MPRLGARLMMREEKNPQADEGQGAKSRMPKSKNSGLRRTRPGEGKLMKLTQKQTARTN